MHQDFIQRYYKYQQESFLRLVDGMKTIHERIIALKGRRSWQLLKHLKLYTRATLLRI